MVAEQRVRNMPQTESGLSGQVQTLQLPRLPKLVIPIDWNRDLGTSDNVQSRRIADMNMGDNAGIEQGKGVFYTQGKSVKNYQV